MNNFGDVLRGLGSVLNPQVMQSMEAEDARKQALQQQFQMLAVKNQMDQQTPEYQAKLEALKNEQGYRGAVSALDPNAPDYQEQIAAAANKFGKPEIAAAYAKAKEDRAARLQSAAEALALRQQQLQQTRDLALERAADQRQRDQINAQFREQSIAIQQQTATANQELRRMGLDIQRQGQQIQAAKVEQAKDSAASRSVQQLQAALEKANLPEADAVLTGVEKALESSPKLAEYLSGPKSLIPDMAVPDDIKAGRQAFQKLFNITLKNRSGAAVTIPEFERLKAEFGTGAFKTPQQLQAALTQAREILSKHYASVASGFGKPVLDAYNENIRQFGGRVALNGSTATPAAPSATVAPASSGWTVKEKKGK
jgi:hypothetical protein